MAQNETIVAALSRDPVPANRECIKNLTEILKGVEDFVKVTGLASASSGSVFPSTNNLASQAKATADSALAIAQSLQDAQRQKRSSGNKIALVAGDGVVPITWSPSMPSTNYEIRVTLFGPNSALSSSFSWHVVDGSEQVNSVQIRFDNTPADYSFAWVVEQL